MNLPTQSLRKSSNDLWNVCITWEEFCVFKIQTKKRKLCKGWKWPEYRRKVMDLSCKSYCTLNNYEAGIDPMASHFLRKRVNHWTIRQYFSLGETISLKTDSLVFMTISGQYTNTTENSAVRHFHPEFGLFCPHVCEHSRWVQWGSKMNFKNPLAKGHFSSHIHPVASIMFFVSLHCDIMNERCL